MLLKFFFLKPGKHTYIFQLAVLPWNHPTHSTIKPQRNLTHRYRAAVKAEEQTSTFAQWTNRTLQICAKNVQTNTAT
jgi:hypothetical protein